MKSYKFRINGNEYNVDINSVEGNIADVTVNGASYQVEMENAPAPVQKTAQAPAAAVASTGSATKALLVTELVEVTTDQQDSLAMLSKHRNKLLSMW